MSGSIIDLFVQPERARITTSEFERLLHFSKCLQSQFNALNLEVSIKKSYPIPRSNCMRLGSSIFDSSFSVKCSVILS